ncbi:hypothetical protein QTP70_011552 [Hemibagrus guttatus]|uniref:Uncharacterized protein n=1 Tax=Hemibagrus guttatus TaxID=175788 RepID=A0AAE0PSL5_9TELE|nr:hypothetical protein QTP70_011552 [Hemibagrus guttatus]KAK3523001.1 hypothetical protein QTP86_010509 [Hemibagrus guttatus]
MGQKITLVFISVIFLGQLFLTQGEDTILKHYTSTYGLLCYDNCRLYENDYYWCNTKKGWDYCSLNPNIDYKGYECKDDHPCDLHGEDYHWCYNKVGHSSYCGKVEPRTVLYKSSTYQSECIDECSYDESRLYYWCNTDKGWDYCSPAKDVTYQDVPCRSDHWCDTHGYDYSWCWTDSSWGYCSLIETSGIYETIGRQKRQANDIVEICRKTDPANNKVTTITAQKVKTIADGRNWKNEIEQIISKYNNSYLRDQAKSNILKTDSLRIDIQGRLKRNNQYYYNLQIQVNMPRQKGGSTTVAQVLIPQNEDIPDRYVRRAFNESFTRRAKVSVDVSYGNIPGRRGQNCD